MFSPAAEAEGNNGHGEAPTPAATPQGHLGAQAFVACLRVQVATPGVVSFHCESGTVHREAALETFSYK